MTPILAFLMVSACSLLDPPMPLGQPRFSTGKGAGTSGGQELEQTGPDTTVFVSAVRYDGGYDWKRDTAWDAAGSEVVLLRMGLEEFAESGPGHEGPKVIVAVRTGRNERVSPGPDLHHIIGGHLFSEYSDGAGTTVTRDGIPLFSYPEQELLCGIVDTCGSVYTLGRSKDGLGLSFRKDGKPLLVKGEGMPFGDFNGMGYGPGGALYTCGGELCFTYSRTAGQKEELFAVTGGEERVIRSGTGFTTHDARILEGGKVAMVISEEGKAFLYSPQGITNITREGMELEDGRIIFPERGPYVFARYRGPSSGWCGIPLGTGFMRVGYPSDLVYADRDFLGIVPEESLEGCYIPSRGCGTMIGNDVIMALTPRDGGRPFIMWRGRRVELEMEGFLSGIEVEISPPRK